MSELFTRLGLTVQCFYYDFDFFKYYFIFLSLYIVGSTSDINKILEIHLKLSNVR